MAMPGRTASTAAYRYGFNGHEKEDKVKGAGNFYDMGMRAYDPRIGRMLRIDPRANEYSWQTAYAYHRNSPINVIDYLGGGDGENSSANSNNPSSMNFGIFKINYRKGLRTQQTGIKKYGIKFKWRLKISIVEKDKLKTKT